LPRIGFFKEERAVNFTGALENDKNTHFDGSTSSVMDCGGSVSIPLERLSVPKFSDL